MTTIHVARYGEMPDEKALDAARQLLFGTVDGWSETDKKAWRRFWRQLFDMEPGELAKVELVFPRNSRFHRKFFALLGVGYDAWEPNRKRKTYKGIPVQKNFDRFREDITILAGFYEQTFDLDGKLQLRAKSISFAKMDDAEFSELYDAVANVLLGEILKTYAGREELDTVVDRMAGFL